MFISIPFFSTFKLCLKHTFFFPFYSHLLSFLPTIFIFNLKFYISIPLHFHFRTVLAFCLPFLGRALQAVGGDRFGTGGQGQFQADLPIGLPFPTAASPPLPGTCCLPAQALPYYLPPFPSHLPPPALPHHTCHHLPVHCLPVTVSWPSQLPPHLLLLGFP